MARRAAIVLSWVVQPSPVHAQYIVYSAFARVKFTKAVIFIIG